MSVAVPFLLDSFRIPADTFQLFLATEVINSRFGSLIAAVHTVTVALLGSAAILGSLRFSTLRVARYVVITVVLSAASLGGLRALFSIVSEPNFAGEEMVYGMRPLLTQPEVRLVRQAQLGAAVEEPAGSRVDTIRKRSVLRVGVFSDRLPFVFMNGRNQLVGFDVEMAQLLARDLGVEVEFVELENSKGLPGLLATGRLDLAMTGMAVTPERAGAMLFSEPYLDETFAFVVKDHLREKFSNWTDIRELGGLSVAIPDVPYYIERVKARAPSLQLRIASTGAEIEEGLKKGVFPNHSG